MTGKAAFALAAMVFAALTTQSEAKAAWATRSRTNVVTTKEANGKAAPVAKAAAAICGEAARMPGARQWSGRG